MAAAAVEIELKKELSDLNFLCLWLLHVMIFKMSGQKSNTTPTPSLGFWQNGILTSAARTQKTVAGGPCTVTQLAVSKS